jgi:hypothetical protein
MRESRFTVEQMIQDPARGTGGSVKETVLRHGITDGTYYTWKAT